MKPISPPVTYGNAAVRGQLRRWKAELWAKYCQFQTAYNDEDGLRDDVVNFAMRGSEKGRMRAFERLKRAFGPGVRFEGLLNQKRPLALWSILKPRGALAVDQPIETGLMQDCVAIN